MEQAKYVLEKYGGRTQSMKVAPQTIEIASHRIWSSDL